MISLKKNLIDSYINNKVFYLEDKNSSEESEEESENINKPLIDPSEDYEEIKKVNH